MQVFQGSQIFVGNLSAPNCKGKLQVLLENKIGKEKTFVLSHLHKIKVQNY